MSIKSAADWIDSEDTSCRNERIERLGLLIEIFPDVEYFVFPGGIVTQQLFEGVRYSFVYAQFLATILLSLAFIERALAALFYGAGRDDLKRASLHDLAREARDLGLLSSSEQQELDRLRSIRNPLAHFREPGHPERVETRAVVSSMSDQDESLIPEEVIANDSVVAIELVYHFLATLCTPQSLQRFMALARRDQS